MNNDKVIYDFLKRKGLSPFAVTGIMGNLFAESGLNPINLQDCFEVSLRITDEQYTRAVDNGSYKNFVKDQAGYGLAQWTYWSRKEALLKYAKKCGVSVGDLTMQLEYLWEELSNTISIQALNSSKSVREASDIILLEFERPADQSDAVKVRRAAYGQKYYDKFCDMITPPEAPEPTPVVFTPYTVRVIVDSLNIRSGPGTDNYVVDAIIDRGTYTIIREGDGPGASKWGNLKSGAGWISLDHTEKI